MRLCKDISQQRSSLFKDYRHARPVFFRRSVVAGRYLTVTICFSGSEVRRWQSVLRRSCTFEHELHLYMKVEHEMPKGIAP